MERAFHIWFKGAVWQFYDNDHKLYRENGAKSYFCFLLVINKARNIITGALAWSKFAYLADLFVDLNYDQN